MSSEIRLIDLGHYDLNFFLFQINTEYKMANPNIEKAKKMLDMTWDTKDNITNMVSEFIKLVIDWNGCVCLALAWYTSYNMAIARSIFP